MWALHDAKVFEVSEAPNLNTGQPWSEQDIADIRYGLANGDSIARIADFLLRTQEEVYAVIAELGL